MPQSQKRSSARQSVDPTEAQENVSAEAGAPPDAQPVANGVKIADSMHSARLEAGYFGDPNATFINRVLTRYKDDPVGYRVLGKAESTQMKCIFILEEPFDVALVDNKGRIRGQYNSADREEVDRLITELAILIRKY